jgi:thioredoxin 1
MVLKRLWICLILLVVVSMNCSHREKSQTELPGEETVQANQMETNQDSILVTFVELGSTRCVPCKMMQPIIEEIEQEYGDQVKVVFHDVWTEQGKPYAQEYNIKLIPTQVFLDKNGHEYFRHEGFFPKDKLVAILKQKGVHE